MDSIGLVLGAIAVLAVSGLPGWFCPKKSLLGQRLAAGLMTAGSALGLAGIALGLAGGGTTAWRQPWVLPWGEFRVALDPLSAVFLGVVFVIPALGSIYGLGYWKQTEHPEGGRKLLLFWGLLAAGMALVTIARDGVLFLVAWEVMALAAYFAATVDEDNPEVRRAGWIYLIATHTGTLCLFAMFALWRQATGAFTLVPAPALPAAAGSALFLLALVGFGFKAGFMPLHVWLPGAHANAPSHVSAVMSGVMLKLGIYGLLRLTSLLPLPPAWWGGTLLALGAVTGLAGILFAVSQHDLKRLLAYSSIENIGIIAMGMGLAMLGRSLGRIDWVLLGLGGSLLHVWNHALFKPLLFFNSGAILHACHTRNMDALGGLGKRMPVTMLLFLAGAVAICGLPPFNGFVSEWFLYIGFFNTLSYPGSGIAAASTAAVALAMIGALAVACFVKAFSAIFLGLPRCADLKPGHDPARSMAGPMAVLAVACLGIGCLPGLAAPLIERAVQSWAGLANTAGSIAGLLPLQGMAWLAVALLLLAVGLAAVYVFLPRSRKPASAKTWDCGYAQPTARMQYTSTSLGQSIVDAFAAILLPQTHRPHLRGLFPAASQFKTLVTDTVLDRVVMPLTHAAGKHVPRVKILQQGQMHWYMLYIAIVTMVLFFLWGMGD